MMNHVSSDMINRIRRIDLATTSPFAISAPRPYGFSTAVSCIDRFLYFVMLKNAGFNKLLCSQLCALLSTPALATTSCDYFVRLLREFPYDGYRHRLLDRLAVFRGRQHALSMHALQTSLVQPWKPG